ncbi:MAG TPA: hypothetical protein VM734_00685 [Kofleriaceae bacterium]|jgi:hypothetical protein|nr:hypothetical protein [Kofleriaceae bacterium]
MQLVRLSGVLLAAQLAIACGGDDDPDAPAADAGAADAIVVDAAALDASSSAPSLPSTSEPDYTLFVNTGINIYWRAASDDVTLPANLEYRMTYRRVGGTDMVALDWTRPFAIAVEAQGRMWTSVRPSPGGFFELWISVRDEDHNQTDFPPLMTDFGIALAPTAEPR